MLQLLKERMIDYGKIAHQRQAREAEISGLKSHYGRACQHVGKLSPGCQSCFATSGHDESIRLGSECNLNCAYCNELPEKRRITEKGLKDQLTKLFKFSHEQRFRELDRVHFGFTGCEPFLYMGRMDNFLQLFEEIQERISAEIRIKINTNGIPLNQKILEHLENLNIGEIELRFHPSASEFSKNVIETMEEVSKRGFRLTVEETLYPPYREMLLEHLSCFEEMGVRHLILKEAPVYYPEVAENIVNDYPDSKFYVMGKMYLYSQGSGYQIIEKSLEKDYSYNILYCSPRTIAYKYSPERNELSNMLGAEEIVFDTDNYY